MSFHTTHVQQADRFRAALAHTTLPIVLIAGARYQNEWLLYALLIILPWLLSAVSGKQPISESYSISFVGHHARMAIQFTLTMSAVTFGLIFVLIGFAESPSHQEQIVAGLYATEDSLFWFIELMYYYGAVSTHPFFGFAQATVVLAIIVGLLCPFRSALSALRGELRTF